MFTAVEGLRKHKLFPASVKELFTTRERGTWIGPRLWLMLNSVVHPEQLFTMLFQLLLLFSRQTIFDSGWLCCITTRLVENCFFFPADGLAYMNLIQSLTHSNLRHCFSECLLDTSNSHDLFAFCYFFVVDSS